MQLKKLEWQRLYPVKKLLFLGAWLFCVFIFVAAIILLVRDGNRENLWLGILCGIAAFVMSCPMIKYIRISYHCMPYFNRIFTKCELEELVKNKKMPTASQLPRPSILRGKGLLSLLLCFIIIL